jgi:hypothetical protein
MDASPESAYALPLLPALERELGPGVAEALARTAQLLRDDNELLDQLAAAAYRTAEDWARRTRWTAPRWNPSLRLCAAESFVCGY